MQEPTLAQLLDDYRRQYHLCCRLKTDTAYTQLTYIRYKIRNMAQILGITLSEGDIFDPTKASILALIARCEQLHTALVEERDSIEGGSL